MLKYILINMKGFWIGFFIRWIDNIPELMPDILKTMPSCNGLPPSHSKPSISQNIRQELLYFKKSNPKTGESSIILWKLWNVLPTHLEIVLCLFE